MKPVRLLLDFLRVRWYFYLLGIAIITSANLFYAYYPKVLGSFTDTLKRGELTGSSVVDYSVQLMIIGLSYGILGGIGQFIIVYLGRSFENVARRRLFGHLTLLSEHYYSKKGVGHFLSYMMNDVTAVRESLAMGVNQTTNATILMVSAVAMMLSSDIPLYVIAVCILPLLLIPFIVVKIGPVIRQRSLDTRDALSRMTESAEEQFAGIRVTKKFAVEDVMNGRFGDTVDAIRDRQIRLIRVSSLFQALIPFLGALSLIVTLAFGGYHALHGTITLGSFVALTLYIRMMINPLQAVGNVINSMQRSRASLDRLNGLFATLPDIRESDQAVALDMGKAAIEVEGLSFSYPDTDSESLHDVSITVQPGKTLGIVGKTGSGKTTLVKLLLRIYDPPAGTIRIGGVDVRDLKLESLRSGIAYVPQDGFLFSTTIRENIAFYRRDSDLESVENAARLAQIHASIAEFPDRFETKLGERGVTLSGGQRQRTSLARGLIKQAPILVLDDSVSAVDAVTEKRIIDSIRQDRSGKTTLIIAHRISALKHADEIIVLDEGRIVQRGRHEELLKQDGVYRALHAIQEEGSRVAQGY
ncbi:ATP-binding cassette domain-containing protein [Cohnella sp. CFH 77786]|uniref:ABC transporter ATP-binding protein n=1 Tax=Cohnella sp. CFH 77786 TaxID=2662265 RepID=UPI001C60BCA5|nr:ABC transporter ATP-binding protein [Cohnella sp. CFH 77786]MBW5445806.1 ATP-binding cassette domain-containing protein [Cohnella sp. CFH 77786]